MHKKEKELLAILGVLLSIGFLTASIYFVFFNPFKIYSKAPEELHPKVTEVETQTFTEAELKILEDSKNYSDNVVKALSIDENYDYVFNSFDSEIKQENFSNNVEICKGIIKKSFSVYGKGETFNYGNQNFILDKSFVKNYYVVHYVIKGKFSSKTTLAAVEVLLKVNDGKITLYGIKQQPI